MWIVTLITSAVDDIAVTLNNSIKFSAVNGDVPNDSYTSSAHQTRENSQFYSYPG